MCKTESWVPSDAYVVNNVLKRVAEHFRDVRAPIPATERNTKQASSESLHGDSKQQVTKERMNSGSGEPDQTLVPRAPNLDGTRSSNTVRAREATARSQTGRMGECKADFIVVAANAKTNERIPMT